MCLGRVIVYGGEAKQHAVAQEDSWRKILEFFKINLQRT